MIAATNSKTGPLSWRLPLLAYFICLVECLNLIDFFVHLTGLRAGLPTWRRTCGAGPWLAARSWYLHGSQGSGPESYGHMYYIKVGIFSLPFPTLSRACWRQVPNQRRRIERPKSEWLNIGRVKVEGLNVKNTQHRKRHNILYDPISKRLT
jgi:hypothetical protein